LRLVIDGYNVIFAETHRRFGRLTGPAGAARPVRPGAGECEQMRTELLQRLEQYRIGTDEEMTVVFDGGEEGAHLARFQHYGGVEVIFSDPSSDADEEIKELVRQSSGARDLRVVTDDVELAQSAKRLGAKAAPAGWLLERMAEVLNRRGDEEAEAEPASKFGGPADYEVDPWVQEFGDLDESDFDEGSPRGPDRTEDADEK